MSDHDHEAHAVDNSNVHPLARKFLWLENKTFQDRFIYLSVTGLIVTTLLGFLYPPHHPAPWEGGYLYLISHGVIGFVAYCLVVVSAWPLFKLLARDENYYGEGIEGEIDAPVENHKTEDDHV
ncbi:MAG: hypothetical protein V3U82_08510 [Robiginitomaculum sp.]